MKKTASRFRVLKQFIALLGISCFVTNPALSNGHYQAYNFFAYTDFGQFLSNLGYKPEKPKKKPKKAPKLTIAETVTEVNNKGLAEGKDFDILLKLIAEVAVIANPGILEALSASDQSLTVFAPNDTAFVELAKDLLFLVEGVSEVDVDESSAVTIIATALQNLIDQAGLETTVPELVANILLYHVSPGAKKLSKVLRMHEVETLLDGAEPLMPKGLRLVDGEPNLDNPRIIPGKKTSNIKASNGIIHTIDRVLIPIDIPGNEPTIADIVIKANGKKSFDHRKSDYDILLAAVLAADPAVVEALSNADEDLTVFAPNDGAFYKLALDLGLLPEHAPYNEELVATELVGLGVELITNVLLYHVSPTAKKLEEIKSLDTIETLLGVTITPEGKRRVFLQDMEPDLKDPKVIGRASNIEAANGIVHMINRVLLPIDL